jgi:signal transduction histidine kinase
VWTDKDVRLRFDRDRDGVMEDAYFSFAGAPIRNQEGVFDRVMLIVSDVTDQVQGRRKAEEAQRQMARSESELRQAMALRDQFLTVASHELRTPLTTVQLQADGLVRALRQGSASDPIVQRSLGRAERLRGEAARLEQLLEGMIDVFSLSREKVKLNVEEVDLAALGKAVVDRFARDICEGQMGSPASRSDPHSATGERAQVRGR